MTVSDRVETMKSQAQSLLFDSYALIDCVDAFSEDIDRETYGELVHTFNSIRRTMKALEATVPDH